MPSKSMNRIASPLMPHPVRYIAFEFDTALIAIGMSLSPGFIVERRSGGDCDRRHSERLEVFRHAFQALSDHRTEAQPSRSGSTTSTNTQLIVNCAPLGACMTWCQRPPGLTSISQTGFVNPSPPYHWATCLGSVMALQTSWRVASKMRVMTMMGSLGEPVSIAVVT